MHQKPHRAMSNSTLTRYNVWVVRQLELNGASCSRNWTKVCKSRSLYSPHLTWSTGSHNKAFALNFDNGVEAIARLPTALAGVPFFTTASEVATLEFVREVLGVRAPRVFAWSANASANPVGAEYIITEKMPGIESYHRWGHIAKASEVFPLLDGVFDIERNFERVPFSQIGSLYFKDDVRADLRDRPLFHPGSLSGDDPELSRKLEAAKTKYRIGPIADRQWWRSERAQVIYDHGPCEPLWHFMQHSVADHPNLWQGLIWLHSFLPL